jgi:hypothetical protein
LRGAKLPGVKELSLRDCVGMLRKLSMSRVDRKHLISKDVLGKGDVGGDAALGAGQHREAGQLRVILSAVAAVPGWTSTRVPLWVEDGA